MTKLTCGQSREHISAYLDGEMEADVCSALEAHLADCETCRGRFEREERFEDALCTKLREGQMPDAMWDSLCAEVRNEPRVVKFPIPWPAALAASIILVAAAGLFYANRETASPVGGGVTPAVAVSQSVGELLYDAAPRLVAFQSAEAPDVETRLASVTRAVLGAAVTFDQSATHHKVELIDVRETTDASGEAYVEVRLNCCGKPVLLALARSGCENCIPELRCVTDVCDANLAGKAGCSQRAVANHKVKMQSIERNGVMIAAAVADHSLKGVWQAIQVEAA